MPCVYEKFKESVIEEFTTQVTSWVIRARWQKNSKVYVIDTAEKRTAHAWKFEIYKRMYGNVSIFAILLGND